jgi:hypothetical protein
MVGAWAPATAPLADLDWLQEPLEQVQWSLEQVVATLFWNLDRQLLIGAVLIHSVRKWITNPGGIIDLAMTELLVNSGSAVIKNLVAGAVVLALLGAAMFVALRPVLGAGFPGIDPRKVLVWFAVAAYLFAAGPGFVRDLEAFRAGLGSAAYQAAASVNQTVSGVGYNNTAGEVPPDANGYMNAPTPLFAATTHITNNPGEITGVDVAASYLFATQEDINGTAGQALPGQFHQHYFADGQGYSPWAPNADEPARQQALARALDGIVRMGTGIIPAFFAVLQAVIYLALGLAAAIILVSLPLALVFAFFPATEVITLSVLRAYLGLLVKTYVISMVLAIEMGFLIYWATQHNWLAFLGMSLVILFFTWQFVSLSIQTITGSLNVITGAIGTATGTRLAYVDPPGMAAGAVMQMGGFGQLSAQAAGVLLAPETGGLSLALAGVGAGLIGAGTAAVAGAIPGQTQRPPGELAGVELEQGLRSGLHDYSRWAFYAARGGGGRDAAGGAADAAPGDAIPPAHTVMNQYLEARGIAPVTSTPRLATPSLEPDVAAPRAPAEITSAPAPAGARATGPAAAASGGATAGSSPLAVSDSPFRAMPGPALWDALAALPDSGVPEDLPAVLGDLPPATQAALARIGARYSPTAIASVVSGVRTAVEELQQRGEGAAIPAQFLDAGGNLVPNSPGLVATVRQAGPAVQPFIADATGQADLVQLAGAGLGLQRTFSAEVIAGAIGQAVEQGGTASTAAAILEVAPAAAWGSRYGAVQSVIRQAPGFGLTSGPDVQRFIVLAQEYAPGALLGEQSAEFPADDAALVGRVQTYAGLNSGRPSAENNTTSYRRFLEDVRAIPTTVTAPVVPTTPPAASESPVGEDAT